MIDIKPEWYFIRSGFFIYKGTIMKKIFLILLLVITTGSCSKDEVDTEKFLKTYKEILIIRESYADTAKANKIVRELMSEKGYTESEFRKDFFKLMSEEDNVRYLDSLRNSIRADLEDSAKAGISSPKKLGEEQIKNEKE